MPADAQGIVDYYADAGNPLKTLQSQWDLLDNGSSGLQVSVAYRSRSDMTIWFDGLLKTGPTTTTRTEKLVLEWDEIFD